MKSPVIIFATLLVSVLFTGFSAEAVVQPQGSFVPQACGEQTLTPANAATPAITAVCVGLLNGTTQRAVQFRRADDSVLTFKVAGQTNLMMAVRSGNKMAMFRLLGERGEDFAMKAILDNAGEVKSVSGEFEANSFLVPALQQMMVIL